MHKCSTPPHIGCQNEQQDSEHELPENCNESQPSAKAASNPCKAIICNAALALPQLQISRLTASYICQNGGTPNSSRFSLGFPSKSPQQERTRVPSKTNADTQNRKTHKTIDTQTHRHTNRQTERQAGKQTASQTDRHRDRQTHRHTHANIHTQTHKHYPHTPRTHTHTQHPPTHTYIYIYIL